VAKWKAYYNYGTTEEVEITLRRAAPEWCNLNCPRIWAICQDPTRDQAPWMLNSDGWIGAVEGGPEDLVVLYTRFVLASSKAFYRKYPRCDKSNRGNLTNGFWHNFCRETEQFRGRLYLEHILLLAFPRGYRER
jgi:hypothetical protein